MAATDTDDTNISEHRSPDIQPQASPATRHMELDALRGFAVMGILAMNIVAFAMPGGAYFSPDVYGVEDSGNIISWLFGFIFFDGKMRGLFSLLFGASMMLVIMRAETAGRSGAKTHYARMAWLALFGLAHFFFLWLGDILFLYAAIGSIAFAFRHWPSERLIKSALTIYAAGFVLWSLFMGSIFILQQQAGLADAAADRIEQYQQFLHDFGFTADKVAQDLVLYRGGFFSILDYKIANHIFTPLAVTLQIGLETLPLMMIGMALLKSGYITGRSDPALYRRWAKRGLGFGGLLYALIAALQMATNFDPVVVINSTIAWTYPARLFMTIGYASLLILVIKRFADSTLIARIASAGRVAFTNYLGTSIIMCFLFYGWGLGLFGFVSRLELWLFVIGTWAVMLLWSQAWLSHFHYGPLEWLWRSLARGKVQNLRIPGK